MKIYLVIQANNYESVTNPVLTALKNRQDAEQVCDHFNNNFEYTSYDYYFYIQEVEL